MKKVIKAGIALAVVGSVAFATPAFAASFSGAEVVVGPDNGGWKWSDWSNLSIDGFWNDMWDNSGDSSTWDNTFSSLIGSDDMTSSQFTCADPADLSDAADGSGDQVLTCVPQLIDNGDGELSVQVEYRFFVDGQTWRQRIMVTNNGTAAVDGQVVDVNYNAYQDSQTALSWTSNAGIIGDWATDYDTVPPDATTPADLLWVTDDRTRNEYAPVVKYAVGKSGSAVLPADDAVRNLVSGGQGNREDDSYSYFELPSITAGQSVEIVTLAKVYLFDDSITAEGEMNSWQTATHNSVLTASADTALESDAYVFAGISDTSKVLNWSPAAAPTPEPTLANTGVDSASLAGLAGLAALALAAGAGVLIARRRRTSAR